MGAKLARSNHSEEGFSLIELVVVVAVLSVLAVGASLAAGQRSGGQSDLRTFTQEFELTRALAVQGRQVRGMRVTPQGFALSRLENGEWVPQGSLRRWRDAVSVQTGLRPEGGIAGTGPNNPNIVILPNGTGTVFSISFRSGRSAMLRCAREEAGALVCG